jgi:hypothetical protein
VDQQHLQPVEVQEVVLLVVHQVEWFSIVHRVQLLRWQRGYLDRYTGFLQIVKQYTVSTLVFEKVQ